MDSDDDCCGLFEFCVYAAGRNAADAIAYSTEYVEMKDMVKAGWALNLLGVAVFTILLYTAVMWAFGVTTDLPEWAFTTTIN